MNMTMNNYNRRSTIVETGNENKKREATRRLQLTMRYILWLLAAEADDDLPKSSQKWQTPRHSALKACVWICISIAFSIILARICI